jgi:hypothetical protein
MRTASTKLKTAVLTPAPRGILVAVDLVGTAGDIELKRQLAELRRGGFEVRSIEHKTAIPGWRPACAHVHYSDPDGDEFVLTVLADGTYKHARLGEITN